MEIRGANGDFAGGANLLQNWTTTGFDNASQTAAPMGIPHKGQKLLHVTSQQAYLITACQCP